MKKYELSEEQHKRYVHHLWETTSEERVNCQWCGKNEWIPSKHYIAPWILTPAGEVTLDNVPLIPLLLHTCGNCGNTLFFNAVVAGVFKGGGHNGENP